MIKLDNIYNGELLIIEGRTFIKIYAKMFDKYLYYRLENGIWLEYVDNSSVYKIILSDNVIIDGGVKYRIENIFEQDQPLLNDYFKILKRNYYAEN